MKKIQIFLLILLLGLFFAGCTPDRNISVGQVALPAARDAVKSAENEAARTIEMVKETELQNTVMKGLDEAE